MSCPRPCLSSARDTWKTPKAVYQTLDAEFRFDFDPCPADPKFDGLQVEWGQRSFVNPPYSELAKWVSKAHEEWRKGKTVVLLIPARTDTRVWHDYIMDADEIRFIRGRLCFDDKGGRAPFPSTIVTFRGRKMTGDRNADKAGE